MKYHLIYQIFFFLFFLSFVGLAYGHGFESEVMPPKDINGIVATFEANPLTPLIFPLDEKFVTFRLYEPEKGNVVQDVMYYIEIKRKNNILLENYFSAKNGVLVFHLVPSFKKLDEPSFYDLPSLTWVEPIQIINPTFEVGGLYNFHVRVVEVFGNSIKKDNISYDFSLSYPEEFYFEVTDSVKNSIGIRTYYDLIDDGRYFSKNKTITFSMFFDWSTNAISRTSYLHEEIFFQKSFEELMIPSYAITINGIRIPQEMVIVDDYSFKKTRTVHILVPNSELSTLAKKVGNSNNMEFIMFPNSEYEKKIPLWFKNNAKWWSSKLISDLDFISSVKFLVENKIIELVPDKSSPVYGDGIPLWLKKYAEDWSDGKITDLEFLKAIQYTVENYELIKN